MRWRECLRVLLSSRRSAAVRAALLKRAREHGRSPRAGLDGENGVAPYSRHRHPPLPGFKRAKKTPAERCDARPARIPDSAGRQQLKVCLGSGLLRGITATGHCRRGSDLTPRLFLGGLSIRRLADTSTHLPQRSGQGRAFQARLRARGLSPCAGLDGENGGVPCPFQGKPYRVGFTDCPIDNCTEVFRRPTKKNAYRFGV
jgi:hypothetical protein